MIQYIYSIQNKLDNKRYIGYTNNIRRRKTRHFYDLRTNKHDNNKLQRAFNKYGEKNFVFEVLVELDCTPQEILELEKEYIKKFKSFGEHGYNLNEGGEHHGFISKLDINDVHNILSVLKFNKRAGQVLAEIFEVSKTTISRIKRGDSHQEYKESFDKLSLDKQKEVYNCFCIQFNLEYKLLENNKIQSIRKLSKSEVFKVLALNEYNGRKMKQISEIFGVSPPVIRGIISGECYKDYSHEYYNLEEEERIKIYLNVKEEYDLQERNFNKKFNEEQILEFLVLLDLGFTPKQIANVVEPKIENIGTLQRLQKKIIYKYTIEKYELLSSKETDNILLNIIEKYGLLNKRLLFRNKFTIGNIFSVLELLKKGLSKNEISKKLGISSSTIQGIKKQRTNKSAINLYEKLNNLKGE